MTNARSWRIRQNSVISCLLKRAHTKTKIDSEKLLNMTEAGITGVIYPAGAERARNDA